MTEGDAGDDHASRNALPAGHALSFEIPGVDVRPRADRRRAPAPRSAATFTASAPGTYLYQSGGDAGRQEAMGLSGALLVRPTDCRTRRTTSATTAYDVEAVAGAERGRSGVQRRAGHVRPAQLPGDVLADQRERLPGRSPAIGAAAGQRVLLRYLNAGYDNTTMTLLGTHQQVVARDARLLTNPFDASSRDDPGRRHRGHRS